MEQINLKNLAERQEDILVSIYLPTHRTTSESKQDKIRYKNLLNEAYDMVVDSGFSVNPDKLLEKAREALDDTTFWNEATEGLAVLIDSESTEFIRLTGETPKKVTVGNRFYLLPLINYYELPNDYYLLDVSRDRFNVYEAGAQGVQEMDTEDIYNRFDELFPDKDIETNIQPTRGGESSFHGHTAKSEVNEKETEKFLRYLSDELDNFFKAKGSPIILFGTTEVVSQFKEIAKNSDLDIFATIEKPLGSMNQSEVFKTLREKLLPKYVEKIDERIEGLKTEIANDRGTDNASRIDQDAKTGRIDSLFISMDYDDIDEKEINDIVANVIINGGEVVVVDEDKSDFDLGIGATYRY